MSDRLNDERVQELTAPTYATAPQYDDVVALAREVQERRAADAERDALRSKVDAIDAHVSAYMFGGRPWSTALRHIFIILHPEGDTPT